MILLTCFMSGSEVILRVLGFSEEKKEGLIGRAKEKYPTRYPIVRNFLKGIEDSFGGCWNVYGNLHDGKKSVKLKREEYQQNFKESALILLPDDTEEIEALIEQLIWRPVRCIWLPGDVAGVPIHYIEVDDEAEIYCKDKNDFYLRPWNNSSKGLFQTHPALFSIKPEIP